MTLASDHPALALQPGLRITPSIRLSRPLGQGGMGTVWVADHLTLHIQVVVKFIAVEHAERAEAIQRFEREAALAAQAKSPHVVQVFDHGISEQGLPYIAMELLEGEDLAQRLGREGRIAPAVLAGWLKQMCSGLGRAHAKGIVHRDVKPENIFLCDHDGEVLIKVLDFGIAKAQASSVAFSGTRTDALMGTPYYMSPEQTVGSKHLDHRTDLWALGVVTYWALTGVRPFTGDVIGALVLAITERPITPPSVHNASLSPRIDAWMERALSRDIDGRFASAREMSEAFSVAVAGNLAAQDPIFAATRADVASDAGFTTTTLSPQVAPPPAQSGSSTAPTAQTQRGSRRLALLASAMAVGVALSTWVVLSSRGAAQPRVDGPAIAARFSQSASARPDATGPESTTSSATVPPAAESAGASTIASSLPTATAGVASSRSKAPSTGPLTRRVVGLSASANPAATTSAPLPSSPSAAAASVSKNPLRMKLE